MEIERKFIPISLPENLNSYKHSEIEQAYLNTDPVIRIRKQNDNYFLTYKGVGMMAHEEYNLSLNEESYRHLLTKADGNIISKTRYFIPLDSGLIAELDVFKEPFQDRILVEVEFDSIESANAFIPPDWFGEDVTYDKRWHNSFISQEQI